MIVEYETQALDLDWNRENSNIFGPLNNTLYTLTKQYSALVSKKKTVFSPSIHVPNGPG